MLAWIPSVLNIPIHESVCQATTTVVLNETLKLGKQRKGVCLTSWLHGLSEIAANLNAVCRLQWKLLNLGESFHLYREA